MFVNHIILDDYKLWQQGDIAIVNTGTATGKTTFIKNVLLPFALEKDREILYLGSRSLLKMQILHDECKFYGVPP